VIAYQHLVWLTPSDRMGDARIDVAVGILLKKIGIKPGFVNRLVLMKRPVFTYVQ